MRLAAQAADGEAEFPAEFVEILAAAILEFDPFEQVPDTLISIEVRGIAGQAFQVQPRGGAGGEGVLHRLAVVNGRAVPDDEELAPDLTEQLAKEGDDRRPAERLRLNLRLNMGKQPPVRRDGADGGEMVARERDAQDGSLAAWGVRTRHEGEKVERCLVYEEDRAVFSLGFA